jgi:pimeloyl-ACP methyl ester carboxylesterase
MMKFNFLVFAVCIFITCNSNGQLRIDTLYDVNINDCKQKILVQSNNTNNPILLYLHGGPGSSIMMYSHTFSKRLIDHFILVNWDQRGAALSYHEGLDTTKISEEQIRDDALELIKYLLNKFHQRKIYLIGHSFGSAVGLQLVADNPEYFKAYIGVGQVATDWDRTVAITYKWLHDTLTKVNDTASLRRIEKDKFPYNDITTKYGGHHRLSINLDSVIKASPYYFDGYLDLLKKGKAFSQYYVEQNENSKSKLHKSIYDIAVPLYFFEGKNDHVAACAPELTVEYCNKVKAPKKKVIWFNCAHYISVEEPEQFQEELINILDENK